jgi:hypothetical protein
VEAMALTTKATFFSTVVGFALVFNLCSILVVQLQLPEAGLASPAPTLSLPGLLFSFIIKQKKIKYKLLKTIALFF